MNRPRILVVEDEPEWLELFKSVLNQADCYDVETAGSFDDARSRLLDEGYAVVIVDLRLGSGVEQLFEGLGLLDGARFLEGLPRRQGKIIVVSVHGTTENMRLAFKRGAYDFISKQEFDEREFLGVVAEAVEAWQSGPLIESRGDLTLAEKKEYERVTLQFLRGKPIRFDVPESATNPWSEEPRVSSNEDS